MSGSRAAVGVVDESDVRRPTRLGIGPCVKHQDELVGGGGERGTRGDAGPAVAVEDDSWKRLSTKGEQDCHRID